MNIALTEDKKANCKALLPQTNTTIITEFVFVGKLVSCLEYNLGSFTTGP